MEWRKRLWGKISGIGWLFRGGVETYHRGNFMESMKVILMGIPSNEGYGGSSSHLLLTS